jgi:Sec-independent protein translocase protein TatA
VLIVFDPGKLPDLGKALGESIRELKKGAQRGRVVYKGAFEASGGRAGGARAAAASVSSSLSITRI